MVRKIEKDLTLAFVKEDQGKTLSSPEKTLRALEEIRKEDPEIPENYEYDERGKPYFPASPYHLSVTHSHGLHAVCVGKRPVGLDAEPVDTNKKRVAERFFSPEDKGESFAHLWCAKEAVSKLLGEGLCALSKIRVEHNTALCEGIPYSLLYGQEGEILLCIAVEKE